MDFCRVAGGVVWREESGVAKLAVIHRPLHGDWSLPKGKLDRGERWHEAALREVAEETGCEARLTRFAGAKLFLARRVPKLVLYWHMQAVRLRALEDHDEVDEVAWLPPREALARLDHPLDRRLLLRSLSGGAWRRGLGRGGRGPTRWRPEAGALRERLVLDCRCRDEQVAPFLQVVENALIGDRTRAEVGADRSRGIR